MVTSWHWTVFLSVCVAACKKKSLTILIFPLDGNAVSKKTSADEHFLSEIAGLLCDSPFWSEAVFVVLVLCNKSTQPLSPLMC